LWINFKSYGYLAGLSDAINEEQDPNLPESNKAPINVELEKGKLQQINMKQYQS
jgi:hypothetical protein